MTNPKLLSFTRVESDGIYYTDLQISINNSVKFDLFEGNDLTATLITNNRKTIALTIDNSRLSMTYKGRFPNKGWYFIHDNFNNLVATLYTSMPIFFGRPLYNITIERNKTTYNLIKKGKESRYMNGDWQQVYFRYDLMLDDEIKCSILNLKKPPAISTPPLTKLEGIIECWENFTITEILCFLQLINLNIDLEFDP